MFGHSWSLFSRHQSFVDKYYLVNLRYCSNLTILDEKIWKTKRRRSIDRSLINIDERFHWLFCQMFEWRCWSFELFTLAHRQRNKFLTIRSMSSSSSSSSLVLVLSIDYLQQEILEDHQHESLTNNSSRQRCICIELFKQNRRHLFKMNMNLNRSSMTNEIIVSFRLKFASFVHVHHVSVVWRSSASVWKKKKIKHDENDSRDTDRTWEDNPLSSDDDDWMNQSKNCFDELWQWK